MSFTVLLIRIYRNLFSPFMLHVCRFSPSCSSYAEESMIKYGVLRGGLLAVRRILKCQPFCVAGFDPVP